MRVWKSTGEYHRVTETGRMENSNMVEYGKYGRHQEIKGDYRRVQDITGYMGLYGIVRDSTE